MRRVGKPSIEETPQLEQSVYRQAPHNKDGFVAVTRSRHKQHLRWTRCQGSRGGTTWIRGSRGATALLGGRVFSPTGGVSADHS